MFTCSAWGSAGPGKSTPGRQQKAADSRASRKADRLGAGGSSHAGIVTTIHDQPATLMQLDEMGRLLETMKDPGRPPLYSLHHGLMQLSSSGHDLEGDAYADAKRSRQSISPTCAFTGTATPDQFLALAPTDNIAEALLVAFRFRRQRVCRDAKRHRATRPADRSLTR